MIKKTDYEYSHHLIERQEKAEIAMLKEFEKGNFTMEEPLIKYNPYIVNSLSAVILFETEEETAVTLKVKGKTKEADFYHTFPRNTKHVLPIVGLYSDYENKIEVYPYQKPHKKVVHTIKTPKVATGDVVEYMKTTPEYMQDNVMFLCPADAILATAVDYAGDVRLDFTVPMVWDIKRLPNGNFIMSSERLMKPPYFMSGVYEFSPVGKIYKEYRVPRGYHHDQFTMENGDIIALNCNLENGTVEDQCVIIDRKTGHVKRTINFINFLDPGAAKSGSWSDEDWFHCNAVWYDKHSNSLTFSGRHVNAIVNIDFDTEELNWIISDPEGWPEKYKPYLFTPVGEGEFGWQYEQHANLITPLGDVMCFDNHQYGSQNPDNYLKAKDNYSRGVKYKIDIDKMEIEQLWQYGKERGAEFFSPYICNVIYYNEGHYLTHSGGIAYDAQGNPSDTLGPQIQDKNARLESITVETINDEVMLELKVKSNYYRASKFPLYSKDGNNLELGVGQLLGSLGETVQMDQEIPAEDTGEIIPEIYEPKIVEEIDMFTFYGKFEKGQLVMLLLENDEETRRYYISTAGGTRGAMCTGTFLPDDERDTRTVITKEGLDGTYDVKLIVDGEKYNTGIQIIV